MSDEIIKLEANGEFPFKFWIEKAVAVDDDKDWIIEGIASTTNIDHDNERMSEDALTAMAASINKDGVPLRVEHQKGDEAIFGKVFKGWVDERKQLHMQARLDKNHPISKVFHHAIKSGTKMGLSVGGFVKRAVKEFSESIGGMVKTFYNVALQEVSVTPRPANYDSWLITKSIAKDVKDAEQYSENMSLRKEFLFENSQLDYLQAFAKSVPDDAWRRVESPEINKNNNSMKKVEGDKKDETTETEKAVTRSEFNSLNKALKDLGGLMAKGFGSIGAMLTKAMDGDAKDQANPDKKKPEDESPTAKDMETPPKEQVNPDEVKPAEEGLVASKAEDDKKDDETTKAEETVDETKEKAETKDDTYDLETVERSIKMLNTLQKRMNKAEDDKKDEETTKAEEDDKKDEETVKAEDETEDETKKAEEDDKKDEETTKAHPLDVLVATMTKTMEALVDRMEKSGKRILGFEKLFIDNLQKNAGLQEEIQKMIKIPGQKKSMAMGVPYMVTKDGHRYPLMAVPEKIEKSDDKTPKDFKSQYKANYSSVAQATRE